ncbi:hypothetical protein FSARC_6800 [Fusarium sarcochroum]|uniref:Uncharacterized protein n=1 Tax=Fusarium sarcochroum TaxID=1208366 RepID=A0A8H4X8Z8_9HYPO|nr:hypothetical protein FSARC_6800 [Fusarium sarcochroum]
MKLTNAIFPLLASQAAAQLIDIQVGDTSKLRLMREAADAEARGDRQRAEELRQEFRISMSKSFSEENLQWKTECRVSSTFEAEIYTVPDPMHAPKEIAWAMNYLDEYWKTDDGGDLPYPGDFDRFMHPDGFRVMRVDYKDLPWAVRKYREELLKEGKQMERKFIAELDGSAFFAPGVVTWLAPLFAGSKVKPGQNACEDELVDLNNFHKKSSATGDVRYSSGYGSRAQIGDSITIELGAEKASKEDSKQDSAQSRIDETEWVVVGEAEKKTETETEQETYEGTEGGDL